MDGPQAHLRLVQAPGDGSTASLNERFVALARRHAEAVSGSPRTPQSRPTPLALNDTPARAATRTPNAKNSSFTSSRHLSATLQSTPALVGESADANPAPTPTAPVQLATRSREGDAAARIVPHPRGSVAPSHRERALDPSDARWVLAVLCWEWMDGGAAAILTPAKRDKLMRAAASMRLRRFDAGLIIAIVQDERRRGGSSLSRFAAARLALVAPPGPTARTSLVAASLASITLAGVMLAVLVMWVQAS
jgi:hypothetical protein